MKKRPNYYRVRVRVRALDASNNPVSEERASTWVELECQDLIEALHLDFNEGNGLKYLFRAGKKSPDRDEDLKKALTYLGFAVERAARSGGASSDRTLERERFYAGPLQHDRLPGDAS